MPVIINGEVVADSDPRAIAHRNRGRRPQQQRNSSGGGFGRIGGSGNSGNNNNNNNNNNRFVSSRRSGNGNTQQQNNGPGPLAGLENMLGVSGKTFKVPAVMGNPSFEVPIIYLIIIAFVTLLTSWRVGLGACLLLYLYYNSLQTRQNPDGPPPRR